MERHFGRCFSVDAIQETDKITTSMPFHAVADNLAIEHVQCRKKGGRSISFVIMRHGSAATFVKREARLGAIKCLNLRLLIEAQNHRMFGRIQIQTDDVTKFLYKILVLGKLERFDAMRL